jgi:hypothetical protein
MRPAATPLSFAIEFEPPEAADLRRLGSSGKDLRVAGARVPVNLSHFVRSADR